MPSTRLILVGGFLGAGKTTLLSEAARRLTERGRRVGLVANDQAADLVDTEMLRHTGASVAEVAGGCFCCRFPDLTAAVERLARESGVEVVLAEPVGSCTDLSATVLQPLKRLHGQQFELAPFSVLIDAKQVRTLARLQAAAEEGLSARFPSDVLYIYQKQLEEADAIVLNKADLLSPPEADQLRGLLAARFPETPLLSMSALAGDGVDAWLELVAENGRAGGRIARVDYDTYAAGEAALGWMNASAKLVARCDVDWRAFVTELLETVRLELRSRSAEIAHLKLHLSLDGGHIVGNVTGNDRPPSVRGSADAKRRAAGLVINARVHAGPDELRGVVETALQTVSGDRVEVTITGMRSFLPARPEPTHRYDSIV
jgi:G3E family GTPase